MVTDDRGKLSTPSLNRRQLLKTSTVAAAGVAVGYPRLGRAQSPVTLRVGVYQEPGRTETQQRFVEAFEQANPTIKIALESADFNTYYTKLNTNLAAGTAPDVMMMSGAYFYNGATRGAFKDLGPYVKAAGIDLGEYFTERGNSSYQGKLMAVPEELAIVALAYNKDLFDEFGVAYPTNDWTWNDIVAAATKLTGTTKDGRQSYGIYSVNNAQEWWGNLVKENGGSFLTPDMKQGALNSPEAVEAIQFAIDLIYKQKVSPTPQGVSSLPGYIESGGSPFMTGLVAMKFQGNYELGVLLQNQSLHWDVVTMPKQKIKGGLAWTQAWVMYESTPHPDEAWKFIEFMLSEKASQIIAATPNKGQCPPLKAVAYEPPYGAPPPEHMKNFLDTYQYGQDFEYHPAWFEYQTAYSKALDAVFAGSAPVKETLDAAVQQVNGILARYPNFQP